MSSRRSVAKPLFTWAPFEFTRGAHAVSSRTLNNPLLAVNWADVRMLSLDPNGTLRILLEEGESLTFGFGSRERMDEAFMEWMRSNDPLLKD